MNGIAAARFTAAPKGLAAGLAVGSAAFNLVKTEFQFPDAGLGAFKHPFLHLEIFACNQIEAFEECSHQRTHVFFDIPRRGFRQNLGQSRSDFVEEAGIGHESSTSRQASSIGRQLSVAPGNDRAEAPGRLIAPLRDKPDQARTIFVQVRIAFGDHLVLTS